MIRQWNPKDPEIFQKFRVRSIKNEYKLRKKELKINTKMISTNKVFFPFTPLYLQGPRKQGESVSKR